MNSKRKGYIIKNKLPKEIERIFIMKPSIKPKKNPDPIRIIIPPGKDKVKKQIEMIKYKINE